MRHFKLLYESEKSTQGRALDETDMARSFTSSIKTFRFSFHSCFIVLSFLFKIIFYVHKTAWVGVRWEVLRYKKKSVWRTKGKYFQIKVLSYDVKIKKN